MGDDPVSKKDEGGVKQGSDGKRSQFYPGHGTALQRTRPVRLLEGKGWEEKKRWGVRCVEMGGRDDRVLQLLLILVRKVDKKRDPNRVLRRGPEGGLKSAYRERNLRARGCRGGGARFGEALFQVWTRCEQFDM